ncbi:hypothetical protein Adt_30871 [Abeliophyllum distichum]|uniref:Transposase n=1 Tax=Abeliophyllum distichum TaxID=126358 RepID=A0ABD1RCG9_9LAMI
MQLVDDVESHIFHHGFYENYERWIYHGESEERPVNMYGQNEGLVAEDEMADVLNDVVRDDSAAAASDLGYSPGVDCVLNDKLPTPPPPPLQSPMHEEELDSLNDDDYLSDL